MKPGQVLAEGIVVDHDNRGVMVGREADEERRETCPPGHTEHFVGGKRVFLSKDQAPILPAFLHPKGKK